VPDPRQILRETFGFPAFRGVQESVIDRVMAGRHSLAVMPTGAGKSLCYQIPALARPGTGLVISPLIALMHDQVRSAAAAGLRAAALTSADDNRAETAARFRAGELDLLYVAPERATTEGFRDLIRSTPLSLIAIDEAHCVSEWGHDFRPDYRLLRPLLDSMGHVPRLALTATADARTRGDILQQLGIPVDGLILAGFDRPNIRYSASPREGTGRQIADLLAASPGPAIVYAQTRRDTEKFATMLTASGRTVRAYHAGLDASVRAANQNSFVRSEDMVMVATVAFGMGIDKPDVRLVVHAGIPKSIEAYYQETGRAGRDGDPAAAHLFWGAEDFSRARQRTERETPPERRPEERARLNALGAFCEAPGCRRAILLRHFGENPPETCGNCDNCLSPPTAVDASAVAQKLLSAVYRTGQRFGLGHVGDVLAGKTSERIAALGHDRLSVFGILSAGETPLLRPAARALQVREALVADDHGGLALGPNARPLLKGEAQLSLVLPPLRKRRQRGGATEHDHEPLFEALRATRRELASEAGVPPYVIFHDAVLRDIAAQRPLTHAALANISGVGTAKLDRYGRAFLQTIEAHLATA